MTEEKSAGESAEYDEENERRLNHFLVMLTDENVGRRWKAAESLARLGDPRAVEPLINALESDEDWRVRQKVAWALGFIGDPRALVPLRRALMNDRDTVKSMIMEALDEIKRKMAGEAPGPLTG